MRAIVMTRDSGSFTYEIRSKIYVTAHPYSRFNFFNVIRLRFSEISSYPVTMVEEMIRCDGDYFNHGAVSESET